jgi:hypothetical protein
MSTPPAPTRGRLWGVLPFLLLLLLLPGCGLIFSESETGWPGDGASPGAAPAPAEGDSAPDAALLPPSEEAATPEATAGDPGADLPPGLGTLRQERISVDLRRGELQMRLTPLSESVTRTAAPDTWERLSALARSHREIFRQETGSDQELQLFLVALYSETETLPFEPGALTLVSRGVRHRPVEIRGLTPGWALQRVGGRETQMAVYAFPPQVDLEGELAVEYQDVRSRAWDRVLPEIQVERNRIRARSGG